MNFRIMNLKYYYSRLILRLSICYNILKTLLALNIDNNIVCYTPIHGCSEIAYTPRRRLLYK
jgi:hypothetical protein